MPEIAGFVDISASRQAVWNLLSDVGRYTEFGTITDVATLVSEGEFGEGSVYTESGKIAGMKSETEWTVTRFAPPSAVTTNVRALENGSDSPRWRRSQRDAAI